MALVLGLSSGTMGCKQLVGIHETQLGSLGGEGGGVGQGSGGTDAAAGGVDGSGGRSSTSTGGGGSASSHSGGNGGSGGASGTGGRPEGSGGTAGPGMGGSQPAGAASGGAGGAGTGGSPGDAGAGGTGGAPAKKTNGTACRMNADCASNVCGSEGVCCNEACDAQCASCVTASNLGRCVVVTTPRTPCAGSGKCAGVCNGVNAYYCSYPDKTTTCAEPSCTNGSARGPSVCDGKGACVAPEAMTCESGCSGSKCAPNCYRPSAANLLSNPGFDGSLSPWTFYSNTSYSSHDYGGCLSSGSCDTQGNTIYQCLPATAGVTYWISFRFKGPDDAQTYETNSGSCGVFFYPSPNMDCSGSVSPGTIEASATSVGGAWSASAGTASGPAPAGTTRMSFYCTGRPGFYDQLYLGKSAAYF